MNRIATRWAAAGLAAWLAAGAAGCEQRPLARDDELRLLRDENRRLQQELLASEQRVADLTAAGATPKPAVPAAEDPYRPVAVRFGKYTGGLGPDGAPGSARLKVVLEPLDAEGDVVKRAGGLVLEALEPAGKGEPPRPYHRWEFPPADLARTWIDSLGVRGYVLKLDWPAGRRPAADSLVLRATFTTPAGEAFEAQAEAALTSAPPKP